jgi:hypothetical protein
MFVPVGVPLFTSPKSFLGTFEGSDLGVVYFLNDVAIAWGVTVTSFPDN